jgi:hypothetical protein
MARGLLFVSQALLDTWAEQGRIDFAGNVMTLRAGEGKGRSYALEPAVRFLKVAGGDGDPHQLLAKVKPLSQLRELGAEAVADSVILGDVAYEVDPGFLVEASAVQAAVSAPRGEGVDPARGAAAPVPGAAEGTATQAGPRPGPGGPPRQPGRASAVPRELEERRKEAEALARFLLDNLS